MPSVELSAAAARERAAEAAEPDEQEAEEAASPQIVEASTAFIVLWKDGEVIITADLDTAIVMHHYPTPDEIAGAGAVLIKDRTAEAAAGLAAQSTVALIEQKQRAAIDQMREAQLEAAARQALAQEAQQRSGKRGG